MSLTEPFGKEPSTSNGSCSSVETSFSDSDVFTKPTLNKYLIKQSLLLHWKKIARVALVLNTLYSIAWLIVNF